MTGIILLVIYTVVMLAVTFKDRAGDSLVFNVANRNIGTLSGALSIAATWIWAPALFVSAEKSYSWGWQGLAWFMVPFLFMIVSGLLSTVDSNLCAVSSLASDVKAGLGTARVSMVVLLVLGIIIANIPKITVTDLFLFYGTFRASTLFTTLLTLMGKKLHPAGVTAGVVLGLLVGLPTFAYGSVCGVLGAKLAGSLLTLLIPGIIAIVHTKEREAWNEN